MTKPRQPPNPGTRLNPSAALAAAYAKRLEAAVDEMAASVVYWTKAAYRREIAMDGTRELRAAMRRLGRRWQGRFDALAGELAEYFATSASRRVDTALADMLRKAGFTVRFTLSPAQRQAISGIVQENVALIRSIPSQHFASVEQAVMRSVAQGGRLSDLTRELEQRHGVTRRRATRIAHSQNRMATASLAKARQLEAGITKARWLHSAGGREPRPQHVAFSGKLYDVAKGHDFGDGFGYVWPGTAPGCRCVSVPVIPGFDE